MYLIGAIIGGMVLGYIVGNYLLDKWINESQDEIDNTNYK